MILSGTATDGTMGMEAIKGEGGITFAQDASAKYDSMPRSAVAAGCVDFELSPEEIAQELARIAKHPLVAVPAADEPAARNDAASAVAHEHDDTPLPSGGHDTPKSQISNRKSQIREPAVPDENGFKKIHLLVRNHSGVDFSLYKSATIQRRIARRMVLNRLDTHAAYAGFLRGNARELDALFSDMLISVTSFFRNPEAFDLLQRKVFPKLLAQRSDKPVRIWVLGCSTGQEAYSLAMAFTESAGNSPRARKLQIFATDLNDALLDKARAGLYAKSLAQDLSPERLRRFFTEEEGGYRATKELRQSVVFAKQNVLGDPPFSRMDLISCRNLLIYFEQGWQKKIIPMFHYALNPEGTLFLGASESVAGYAELFEPLDKKHKIFAKRPAQTPALNLPMRRREHPTEKTIAAPRVPTKTPLAFGPGTELNAQREADRLTVNQFAPPGVLINAALQVLQFRGPTGGFLEPPTGNASFDVLKMAREGLMLPLRAAINKAKKDGKPVRKEHVSVRQDSGTRLVTLQVTPLKNLKDRCFLILFEDERKDARGVSAARLRDPAPGAKTTDRQLSKREESRRIQALDAELAETRDYIQSVQEQNEAASEELQASNEEVTSANEELQSINEELETSKEELESANEELTTVNEEMANRNTELNRLNADLNNLHVSINTAILVLGRDLTIRRFTPLAEKAFNLLGSDLGRPLSGIRHNLDLSLPDKDADGAAPAGEKHPSTLEDLVREVLDTISVRTCEVRDRDGRWYSLRVRPYLTLDRKIDGAVLVLVDIDALKRSEQDAKFARAYAEATLRTSRSPLLVLRPDLRVNTANEAFYKNFKTTPAETEGRLLWDLDHGQWKIPRLREKLEDILPRNSFFDDFEVVHDFPGHGSRTMLLNARRLDSETGAPEMILLAFEDVSERLRLDEVVRRNEARFRALAQASPQIVWTTNVEGLVEEDSPSWRAFTGQTLEQWRGWGWLDAIHPDDRESTKKVWSERTVDQRVLTVDYRLRRADGVYRWTSVRAAPVLNPDGRLLEWIGTNTDITERKEAAQRILISEIRYRRLFEAAKDGILLLDPVTRRIVDANPFMTTLLGYAREELLGKELWQIGLLKDEAASLDAFRQLQQEGFIRYDDLPLKTKNGEQRDVEFVSNRYDEGGTSVIQCNIREITERKQAETALKESQERYRVLFSTLPVAAFVCDRNATIQYYNPRAAELWQREPKSGVEQHCGSMKLWLMDGTFLPHAQSPMMEVLRTGIPARNIEVFIERPNGSRLAVIVNFVALKNAKSEIVGAVTTFDDITELKEAEAALRASEERYRTLFSSMDEGYCVIEMLFDPAGRPSDYRFLEVNPAFEIQSGMHDVMGKRMREFVADIEKHWLTNYGQVALTGESIRFANEYKSLGRWFDVCAFRLGGPDSRKVAVLFTDITALKRNTADLERLRDEAVAASRAKDEFLATLSHELRTPLNPVLLLASEAATNDDLPEEVRADFDMIRKNISLEARLIDDLLDLTRISRGKLKIEQQPCDANAVLRDAVAVVRDDVDEKNIHLSLDLAAERANVFGDPVRLQQIFWNVLRNAVHFTPKEGTITIQSRVNPSNDELVVTMTDTGVGIVADDLTRIFETFAQGADAAAGPSRRAGGLGLGLAISRNLVELHAGTIIATSPGRGGGSTFTIKLPLLAEPVAGSSKAAKSDEIAATQIAPTSANPFPRSASEPKARVMVAEDHATTRTALRRLLERRNFEVVTAGSVAEALAVANQGVIDLIISDIGLPDADGYSLMRQLRVSRPGLLGIALSGYGAESDLAKSREAGFADHLIKPVSIENLDRVLKRLGCRDLKSL